MRERHDPRDRDGAGGRERRTALVTGASSGIGEAFANVFAAHGFDLVLTARRADRLAAVAERLARTHGARTHVLPADLSAADAVAALCAGMAARGVVVDALVNAAGFGTAGRFLDAAWPAHAAMLRVMSVAPAELLHRLVPSMVERGYGRIVNVASLAGLVDAGAGATYGAAKTFLVSLSTSLHRELQPLGVHVTAVCPGLVRTGFHDRPELRATVAAAPGWMWTPADRVAAEGFAAVMRGTPTVVNGRMNRLLVTTLRLVPRRLLTGAARQAARVARRRRSAPPRPADVA